MALTLPEALLIIAARTPFQDDAEQQQVIACLTALVEADNAAIDAFTPRVLDAGDDGYGPYLGPDTTPINDETGA